MILSYNNIREETILSKKLSKKKLYKKRRINQKEII